MSNPNALFEDMEKLNALCAAITAVDVPVQVSNGD